jgi:hypothetical protein
MWRQSFLPLGRQPVTEPTPTGNANDGAQAFTVRSPV